MQQNSKRKDPRRFALVCFAVGSAVVFAGNRPACDGDPPTLTCDQVSLNLDPGGCVELTNPCGTHQWDRLDGFRLCDPPNGLFIQTQRSPRTRFLCADTHVATLVGEPVDFFYSTPTDSGVGTFRVTIGTTPLAATVSASPSSVAPGGSSQLNASATGGQPPYSYAWLPAGTLSASDVANPVATPPVSTQYTVVVTDSSGAQVSGAMIVNVGIGLTAAASPAVINAGQTSNLSVQVAGGTPPYSYAWTPAASLSAANIAAPIAAPSVRTTYTVTVTDFFGASAMASIVVDVRLQATASANPSTILAGAGTQLDVAVTGGSPPYAFDWAPAASLDDSTVQDPVATPTMNTTYNVVVTDANNTQLVTAVSVAVQAGGLTACVSLTQPSALRVQGDGSCSTGNIVQYRWWSDYRATGLPPQDVTTTPISPLYMLESFGPHTFRLEVVDAGGATAVVTQGYVAQ